MVSGLVAGSILNRQRKKGHWGGKVKSSVNEKERWESGIYGSLIDDDEDEFSDSALSSNESVDYNSDSYSSVPLFKSGRRSRISGRKAVFQALPKFVFVIAVLLGCNWYHTLRTDVSNEDLNQSIDPQSSYLLTLILMTAPRRTGAVYIKETLSSYLENFPDEDADELYSRIQIVIYTHFTDFTGYDEAKAYFDTIPKARKYVRWVREEGSEISQRKHLVSAIRKIGTEMDSAYLGIMEDDFPFCKHGWQDMLNTVYEANQRVKEHCGVFVGTGGSGLIFKRAVALTASFILENDVLMAAQGLEVPPPDITLQDCMLGLHDYCSTCAGTMVISRTLAQKHLGYNSSTSGDGYDKNQFQCGWRHPFNGLPNVHSF
ncbi:hypothetical protein BGW38_000194 [Lunasporangiospora selenospora]|uniref:Uncharacterized protein n=1 Tax=Lunasporangiospora selenospora TaxID=979761 RepID=A0A9P6FV78_9FUNG|nr:hypothetical protein BGW38_000194 [Lunasporangiospora selenospora]